MTVLPFVLAAAAFLDDTRDHAVIAGAIANVVETEPPLFRDDEDKHSVRLRVDGDCRGVCEHPSSWCSLQIHVSSGGSNDPNDDPESRIRAGMAMLHTSMRIDPVNPVSLYASGARWQSDGARRISRDRVWIAHRVFVAASAAPATYEVSL